MASRGLFNGIAHNIAHHAQSGVSDLHPYIVVGCRSMRLSSVAIDLLSNSPWPADFPVDPRLRSATEHLAETFRTMVGRADLDLGDVMSVTLSFFPVSGKDDHSTAVRSRVELTTGRVYEHFVPISW